ncbi:uncharacterized protein IUM83_04953 [Phytophthora cinnamomi]|uniref:uncharacterized protein n=1 Tax=Phytophthora cinnamomi TaxID=4785 RepID=UPI00355AAEA2|nr:hypothetical protein IUM83_04953 [Phytophthora cinnamomi]
MTLESHLFAAALGALVPSFLLLLQLEKQWIRELPPQCSGVLDSVLWLAADAIFPHLECLGAPGRALYRDFYAFDLLLFPLIYSTALLGLLRRLWPRRRLVWMLPVLAALCDVVENVSILQLLRLFPQRWQALEGVVSALTRTKWVAVFSALAFVLVGGLKWLLQRGETKSKEPKLKTKMKRSSKEE